MNIVPAFPFASALLLWLLQATVPQAQDGTVHLVSSARDLGVVGLMCVGIIALWRDSRAKDTALLKMAETVTTAMITAATSNAELRHIIEESVKSKVELAESVKELTVQLRSRICMVEPADNSPAAAIPRRTAGS